MVRTPGQRGTQIAPEHHGEDVSHDRKFPPFSVRAPAL
jgi:hypothetical protein